jgi:hypothetical protein
MRGCGSDKRTAAGSLHRVWSISKRPNSVCCAATRGSSGRKWPTSEKATSGQAAQT